MRIRLHETATGVAPADALRWWSDFRSGPHDHARFPGQTRRVLHRDEAAGTATMEDRVRLLGVPLFTERTSARVTDGAVVFEGANTYARFSGRYSFGPAPDGTRVALDARVDLKGPLRPIERLARPVVVAILRADLRHHARDLETDLTPARR